MLYYKTSIQRKLIGISLVEILVSIGILAILLALLLPAVQKVRLTASILREKNKVKQIELALHLWSEHYEGRTGGMQVFRTILPFLDYPLTKEQLEARNSGTIIPPYINNDDPTIETYGFSYAYNSLIHGILHRSRLQVLRDGASNTIEVSTHYAFCKHFDGQYMYTVIRSIIINDHTLYSDAFPHLFIIPPNDRFDFMSTTFANKYMRDVLPTSPEAAVLTFQPRPPVDQCDPRIPQSPYSHGLLAGIADGSVRMISPNISPRTFWAAITPDGGEVLGPDW